MELVFQGGQSTKGNSAGLDTGTGGFSYSDWDARSDWWVFDGAYKSYALSIDGSYFNASDYSQHVFGAIGSTRRIFRTWGLGASLGSTLSWSSSQFLVIGAGRTYDISSSNKFTPRSISGIRVYSCTIWEGEDCVRGYVPCSSPNGVYGLYDIVNGGFVVFRKANPFTLQKRTVVESLPPTFGGGSYEQTYAKFVATAPVTSNLTITALDYDDYNNPISVVFNIAAGSTVSDERPWYTDSSWNPIYTFNKEYDDFYYYMAPLRVVTTSII